MFHVEVTDEGRSCLVSPRPIHNSVPFQRIAFFRYTCTFLLFFEVPLYPKADESGHRYPNPCCLDNPFFRCQVGKLITLASIPAVRIFLLDKLMHLNTKKGSYAKNLRQQNLLFIRVRSLPVAFSSFPTYFFSLPIIFPLGRPMIAIAGAMPAARTCPPS